MNINVMKIRRIAILLGLVMMLAVVCASCVNLDDVAEVNPREALEDESGDASDTGDDEIVVPDGATNPPQNIEMVNTAPLTVAISGTCEKDAIIRVKNKIGGIETETRANGEYFIIKVDFAKDDILELTAEAEGSDVSPVLELRPMYDGTADALLDGNNVSVGTGSRLYFDEMRKDLYGENLFTESQFASIGKKVNDKVHDYYYGEVRANGQKVELIFVLVPNVTTIYPEIVPEYIPEGETKPMPLPEATLYDRIAAELKAGSATVVDMKENFLAALADPEQKKLIDEYGGIYRVNDSALTDYGGYLTYSALMKEIEDEFPDAAARPLSEFGTSTVTAKGGNLVKYRGLNSDIITEELCLLKPSFKLDYGETDETKGTYNLGDIVKYEDPQRGNFNYFLDFDANDEIIGVSERWIIDTAREDVSLPNAIIYRDYGAYSFSDILAERFQKSVFCGYNPDPTADNFNLNFSELKTYGSEKGKTVDYVIVIVSEENFDTAFNSYLPA